jgi:NitT/TauT family transport system substrate-binding protein
MTRPPACRSLLAPLALGCALLLAACGTPAPSGSPSGAAPAKPAAPAAPAQPTAPAQVETVQQGIVGVVSDAGIILGIERGYFREAGINIEGTRIGSASEAIQFLATGQLDVLGGGPGVGLYNAFAQGSRLRVVADKGSAINERFGLNPLLVRKDLYDSGQLREYSQLRGKRIAMSGLTTSNRVDVNKILALGGLTEADVELTAMSFPDMVPALANGNVDFAIGNEPPASVAVERGVAVRIATVADIYPNHQVAIMMYSEQFATQRREAARRYMIAYLKGVRDYHRAFTTGAGKPEVVASIAKHSTVKNPATIEAMAPAGLNPTGRINVDSLVDDQRFYVEKGTVTTPIDMRDVVDHGYVEAALQVLGP